MKRSTFIMLFVAVFAIGGAMSAFAAEKLGRKDKAFVTKAASAGMMEVQLGQMAQQNGQSQEVKDFGSRMVADHTKANDELKQLAQTKGISLAESMDRKDKKMVDKFQKVKPQEFDKEYMKAMVKDHQKDVADFRKASKDVKDPDIQAFAAKTLPILEQHLQQAQEVAKKVGAGGK
ncbi:DUF4142 domain-containing protein [Geomonas sp. RF6]|uniref:DUF4142 domain-containing protein n=1 Tax=Geomonas sp. RF6 TaxID=2897342 RepID=UPI001E360E87|nr:DUF4142 domain-containing protein [Geomonas sp. RF6]UFS71151.1 DUF4142 domain-containing protein [Geomonas sp. RF6]